MIRRFSDEDLARVVTLEDLELATVFMNKTTFSKAELGIFRRIQGVVKTYKAQWDGSNDGPVQFYAANDRTARWFLSQEYVSPPDTLFQIITTQRAVKLDA